MFGWINDCTECLVISKFGQETWHKIKEKANCEVEDSGFLRYHYYPDSDTVTLVVAASEVLGISVDDVLYAFGDYFIDYVSDNGYSNILECLGSNLRDWLSNLNSLHDHLKASYPKGFVAPVFWSEDDVDFETTTAGVDSNAILVHYFSQRGSLLVPLVVGCIKKLSKVYFDLDITMTQLQLQDEENGVNHTSWRVMTKNPEDAHKLRGRRQQRPKRTTPKAKDDETVESTATNRTNFETAFLGGQEQASNLRVEELVKRSFHNMECELYYALTREQYMYLIDYWQKNKMEDKWCYEIWTMEDRQMDTWPTMADLPTRLNPASIDSLHFGGKMPETGKYPPLTTMELQSFPPFIRLVNISTGKYIEIETKLMDDLMLEDVLCNPPVVVESDVASFPSMKEQLRAGEYELEYVIWNPETENTYHTFTIADLKTTTTKQMYDLVPLNFDPVIVKIRCTESVIADEDEEDI